MRPGPGPGPDPARAALVRRGLALTRLTVAYNVAEAAIALGLGVVASSVALIGFGIDSGIEFAAAGAALWRVHAELDPARRDRAERVTLRVIGWCFVLLAVYVATEASLALWRREAPDASVGGVLLAVAAATLMPVLARAKRRVAAGMGSAALTAEAVQTALCGWLSLILLVGLGLNAALGWWWADPLAALAMAPIIGREGLEALRGRACADGCHG